MDLSATSYAIDPLTALSIGSAASSLLGGGNKQQGGQQQKQPFGLQQAAGGALGAAQLIGSAIKKDQAQAPPLEDPGQRALLEDIEQRRKSAQTGADTAGARRAAEQLGQTTQANIAKVTGGDVGGTVSGLLKAQRATGQNINEALAAGQQRQQFFTGLAQDLQNRIAQRKLDLQQFSRVQALGEAAQLRKEGISNLLGFVGTGTPPQLGGQQGQQPAQPAAQAQTPPATPPTVAGGLPPATSMADIIPGQPANLNPNATPSISSF